MSSLLLIETKATRVVGSTKMVNSDNRAQQQSVKSLLKTLT